MKRRSKRLKTKQTTPQTSLSTNPTTQAKSKPNLTPTRVSRSRSNVNLKAELSEDCCDNAKIETFLKQKEQSIDMSSRASTSSSSGELASTSSSTESKELKESTLTSSVSYLPIELKLTSIDLSCKDFKPLEDNFLLADSTGLTGHIKKLIAKAMNISLNKFEVIIMSNGFEINSKCPLVYIKDQFFKDKKTIVMYYAIIERKSDHERTDDESD